MFLLSLLCSALAVGRADVQVLEKALREQLPEGWSVHYDAEMNWLDVQRDELVLGYMALPSSVGYIEPDLRRFSLAFRVGDKIDEAECARRMKVNEQLDAQKKVFYQLLVDRGINGKGDSFFPKGYVDGLLVRRYEEMHQWRLEVPGFYYGNLSLTGIGGGYFSVIGDEKMECCAVTGKVLFHLLKPYKHMQPRMVDSAVALPMPEAGFSEMLNEGRERDKVNLTRFLLRKQMECQEKDSRMSKERRQEYLAFIKKHEALLANLGKAEVHYQLSIALQLDSFDQVPEGGKREPNPHAEQALKAYQKFYRDYSAEEREDIEKKIKQAEMSHYLKPGSLDKVLRQVKEN